MKRNKIGTVALVVRFEGNSPLLVERFSDEREIEVLALEVASQEENPLSAVYELRTRQTKEDEEFGDYVEQLLSRPFVRPEVQEHGVQWLKSKIRIEEFQKCETDATQVIADYAFKMFQENMLRRDFLLAGPLAKVRVRVFVLNEPKDGIVGSSQAA